MLVAKWKLDASISLRYNTNSCRSITADMIAYMIDIT